MINWVSAITNNQCAGNRESRKALNKSDPFGEVRAQTDNASDGPSAEASEDRQLAQPVQADHVGALLCATRMRMGRDLQQIARILKIRYGYLVAIEDGRFEDLPGTAYSIGFVRAYADFLGLDGNEVVRRLRAETAGAVAPTRFEFPVQSGESGLPNGGVLAIAIVMGMVFYSGWYVFTNNDRNAVDLIQEVPERLTALLGNGQQGQQVAIADESAASRGALIPEQSTSDEPRSAEVAGENLPDTPGANVTAQVASSDLAEDVDDLAGRAPDLDMGAEAEEARDVERAVVGEARTDTAQSVIEAAEQVNDVEAQPEAIVTSEEIRSDGSASGDENTPQSTAAVQLLEETEIAAADSQGSDDVDLEIESQVEANAESEMVQQPVNNTSQGIPQAAEAGSVGIEVPEAVAVNALSAGDDSERGSAPAAPTPEADSDASFTDEPEQDSQIASAASGNDPGVIELRAKSDSWIQVRDGNDLLLTRLLRKGEVYRVPDREGLTLMTGNAGGLEVFVGGDLAPPLGNEGVVRRGVPLNAESLKSGVTPG